MIAFQPVKNALALINALILENVYTKPLNGKPSAVRIPLFSFFPFVSISSTLFYGVSCGAYGKLRKQRWVL